MNSGPEDAASGLIGTWRLKSLVREVAATGERFLEFGEHPQGFIGYSGDGRMYAILVADNRIEPKGEPLTDDERARLHRSMIAYTGTYTVDHGKVTHHVDVSWNGLRSGTDQVRFFKIDGNTLTITTARISSPVDGRDGVGILTWERVG